MTDVRLTATNPEDSSVVPVACNAKGELKLEELPEFDGNVDGDLSVTGTITADGSINTDTGFQASYSGNSPSSHKAFKSKGMVNGALTETFQVFADGDIIAAGNIQGGNFRCLEPSFEHQTYFGVNAATLKYGGQVSGGNANFTINYDGSTTFAGGKAGFTKEGNLFCTTLRGDLVVLENTSGGFGAWVEYIPSSRKDLVKEKLEDWSEKDKSPEIKPIRE